MSVVNEAVITLRRGQEEVLAALENVRAEIRSFPRARKQLPGLNNLLLAHWSRQKDEYYRQVLARHPGQRAVARMVEFLQVDLKEVKLAQVVFFDHYTGSCSGLDVRTFPKDFSELFTRIVLRIRMEEEYLVPLLLGQEVQPGGQDPAPDVA